MRKILIGLVAFVASFAFAGNNQQWKNSGGALSTQAETIHAPYVSGIVDGQSVTFSGSGFGTNVSASNQQFLGGVAGPVESLSNGADFSANLPSGWTQGGNTHTVVSTTHVLNGTKSLLNDFNATNNWQFGSTFSTGTGQKALYIRASYYFINPNNQTTGQLKLFRFTSETAGNGIQDINSFAYFTRYYGGSSSYIPNAGGANISTSEGGGTTGNFVEVGIWVQAEMLLIPDSTAGAGDGSVQWRHIRLDTGAVDTDGLVTGRSFWTSGNSATPFSGITMQMGFYNEWNNPLSVWIDRDVYVQWNATGTTLKWVQLCNAATSAAFTTSTRCVIQKFTSWANTSITVTLNQGQFSSLTGLYFYAMNGINSFINTTGILLQFALIGRRRRAANDDNYYLSDVA
jgi:hypothetical protein